MLFAVGALTLIAAAIGAIYAYKAYTLEARPALAISPARHRAEGSVSLPRMCVVSMHDAVPVWRPWDEDDDEEEGHGAPYDGPSTALMEFRNVGRFPIVRLQATLKIAGPAGHSFASVVIGAIPAGDAVMQPVSAWATGGDVLIDVISATHVPPSKSNAQQSEPLRFVNATTTLYA
jgi:hypothetical protein